MIRRALAIVNPVAGGGRSRRKAKAALSELERSGIQVEVVTTRGPGHATELARAAAGEGRRTVLAVGGDGTACEVAEGLLSTDVVAGEKPRLGILPVGTGNSFQLELDDSLSLAEALAGGRSRKVDVVRVEHDGGLLHSLNIVGLGFVATVGTLTVRHGLRRWGQLGYVLAVLVALARLQARSIPVDVDDGLAPEAPVLFVAISNSRFTAGKMKMAPFAEISDGRVDVIRAGAMGRLELLRTFPRIFSGSHLEHPAVHWSQTSGFDVGLKAEVDLLVDGELHVVRPRRVEVLAEALEVVG